MGLIKRFFQRLAEIRDFSLDIEYEEDDLE
jgi:hypothetical protein